MIIQFIKNAVFGAARIPDHLIAVIDGSLKFRLRKMRYQTFSDFQEPSTFDHDCLRLLASRFNFQRIKHADRIGVTYWASAKGDCNRTLAPVNYYTLLDGKKRTLQQQTAILEGNLELPLGAWGEQLDCLHTFVASSSKQKIVGQYVNIQEGSQEFIPFARSCEFNITDSAAWSSPQTVDLIETFQPDFAEWERTAEEESEQDSTDQSGSSIAKKPRKRIKGSRTQQRMKAIEAAQSGVRKVRRRTSVKSIAMDGLRYDVEQPEYVTA